MNTKLTEFANEITQIDDANDFILFLILNSGHNIETDGELTADICYAHSSNINVNVQYNPDCHHLCAEISEIKNEDDASKAPRTWAYNSEKDDKFYLI
ncbi:hypothetical protein [Gluconobacter sp. OJB]|uniref:hypothetical protein n=1 Tax=Gluconobacter sp. OJB TaxID=3145196 RepID=UPI0031FA43AC